MGEGLRNAVVVAGFWAVWAVWHAIRAAEAIAAGVGPAPGRVAVWSLFYLGPLAIVGVWLLIGAHRDEAVSDFMVRTLRMGLAIALFGVLLAWSLVLYASFVATLVPRAAG